MITRENLQIKSTEQTIYTNQFRTTPRGAYIYICLNECVWVRIMVFSAIFNNISVISWQSVLLVEETRVPGENHWPVASHWQTLLHNAVSSTPRHERGSSKFELTTLVVIGTDCIGNCKSNYHTITTATAP